MKKNFHSKKDSIYLIGGYRNERDTAPIEQWKFDEASGNFTVTLTEFEMEDFYQWPETIIVDPADYAHCT